MKPLLLIDANNLCHRAFYAMGDLRAGEVPTGVLFGFFRDIIQLQDQHRTDRIAFCFDRGRNKRTSIYPKYKQNRRGEQDPELRERKRSLRQQIYALQDDYLPRMGFSNIFSAIGYEADDIIASLCESTNPPAIIVSTDQDLFQLLGEGVSIWNPRSQKMITASSFSAQYGIESFSWSDVKAMSGCSTDNIAGIKGIGEKTAIKYLRGELKSTTKAYQSIVENDHIWRRNLELVRLPLSGCPEFEIQTDRVTKASWMSIVDELKMTSIKDYPLSVRRRRSESSRI